MFPFLLEPNLRVFSGSTLIVWVDFDDFTRTFGLPILLMTKVKQSKITWCSGVMNYIEKNNTISDLSQRKARIDVF